MTNRRSFLAFLCFLVVLLPGCSKHDQLITEYQECEEKWANLEAQLQRRYDLIPNIVSTVKAQAAHEKDTYTAVTEARSQAASIKLTSADLEDPAKMAAFSKAQGELSGALSRLMMVQERYPELRSSEAFADLRIELEGTENRILRAREEYNRVVKEYNTTLMKVSGEILNSITGQKFAARIPYKATAAAVDGPAPKVSFD